MIRLIPPARRTARPPVSGEKAETQRQARIANGISCEARRIHQQGVRHPIEPGSVAGVEELSDAKRRAALGFVQYHTNPKRNKQKRQKMDRPRRQCAQPERHQPPARSKISLSASPYRRLSCHSPSRRKLKLKATIFRSFRISTRCRIHGMTRFVPDTASR